MTEREDTPEFDLSHYLRVLRRRKAVVAAAVIGVVGAAVGLSSIQTPVYAGKSQVLLQLQSNNTPFNPNTGQPNDPTRQVSTQIQIILSRPIRKMVESKLGYATDVNASPVGQTDVIEISAQSPLPPRAAAAADAYANAYIEFRRTQAVNDLLAAASQIQTKVQDLQSQINALSDRINAAPPGQRAAVEASVGPERDALLNQQGIFKEKLNETQVDAALTSGDAQLVAPAMVPTSPVRPRPIRNAILALALGLVMGIGLAFVLEHLDDSIKTTEDLKRVGQGRVRSLGVIPAVAGWKNRDEPRVISLIDPSSPAAESYRALRTSIRFLGLDTPVRVLQVTSPSASEGKTTTLANLGVALAAAGQRVLIGCCDLRRPRIHEFFGLSKGPGLTSVVVGELPLAKAVQPVPQVNGLFVLASGSLPPNPSELLSSARMAEVIGALKAQFDVVLLDSPPVLPVTDAAVLSSLVDATLIVVTSGTTTRRELSRAVETLRLVDAPLAGAVLNGVTSEAGYGYGRRYRYREYAYETRRPESGNGADRVALNK